MATDVELCNRAIIILGEEPINALDQTESDPATILNAIYTPLKKSLLSKHRWHFTRRLVKLTKDADAPAAKWLASYQFPVDRITGGLFEVFASAAPYTPPYQDWTTMRDRIYANTSPDLWAMYGKYVAEGEFPPYFEEFFVAAIRAEVAFALTDQQNTATHWNEVAYGTDRSMPGGLLLDALSVDAQQHPSEQLPGEYDLLTVRA